ncbi:MAG: B12-binding domain-containing radical SAM protein, partial [Desulfobacteraceae bacterium]|nr:B12-binding domain-containing radical SAM protein [Desulfobacteraceae bacterium]
MSIYPRVTLYDHSYETFAIQYLASTLRMHGFPVQIYYDCSMNKDYLGQDFFLTNFFSYTPSYIAEKILASKPDVVGFSIITTFLRLLNPIIRELKQRKPDIVIIAGGPHCSLAPAQVLENRDIDFVFVGDADISLPEFLNECKTRSVDEIKAFSVTRMRGIWNVHQGLVIERGMGPFMADLDRVPFPEKDPYYQKNPSLKIMYTATCSRGCIFSCTYCNSNTLRKKYLSCGHNYFRIRSVKNVMEELHMAREKYNPSQIMFLDNLFAPGKKWLREFSEAYKREIGLPFFCETNPNVHTKETMKLLAEANCTLLQFGFQSANEEVRRTVLHRRETNARILELVSEARRLGMFVSIDHIANLPGEVQEHLDEAIALYHELRPNWVNLGFLQYYPEAEIIDIAIARKAIFEENLHEIYSGDFQSSFRLLSKSHLGDYY